MRNRTGQPACAGNSEHVDADELDFSPEGGSAGNRDSQPRHARRKRNARLALSRGKFWIGCILADAGATRVSERPQRMHMVSQYLDAAFGPDGDLREVHGTGGVQVQRQIGSSAPQESTSREMVARTAADGGDWTSVDQTGDVRVRQSGSHGAVRPSARFRSRSPIRPLLSGSVVLSDPQSRVTAQTVTFHQLAANEFHAEGHVVSSEVSAQGSGAINLAPSPARISSEHLLVNTATGHAVYSEQARLWQGDSLIEADTITNLDRGHPACSRQPTMCGPFFRRLRGCRRQRLQLGQLHLPKGLADRPRGGRDAKPEFWRAEANRMTYLQRSRARPYWSSVSPRIRARARSRQTRWTCFLRRHRYRRLQARHRSSKPLAGAAGVRRP